MNIVQHGEERLLTVCNNLSCLTPFHPIPNSEEEVALFNELLERRRIQRMAWLALTCPACGHRFQIAASTLTVCTCGQDPHNPDHK